MSLDLQDKDSLLDLVLTTESNMVENWNLAGRFSTSNRHIW